MNVAVGADVAAEEGAAVGEIEVRRDQIEAGDPVARSGEGLDDMAADEAGGSGDEDMAGHADVGRVNFQAQLFHRPPLSPAARRSQS